MQSAKKSKPKKIRANIHMQSMPNCCGVGMLTHHSWNILMKTRKIFDWFTAQYIVRPQWLNAKSQDISANKLSRSLFAQIKLVFKSYSLLYVALPQNTPLYKRVTEWYLKHHFKLENKTQSNHGKYDIYVLSITKEEWQKHYAL